MQTVPKGSPLLLSLMKRLPLPPPVWQLVTIDCGEVIRVERLNFNTFPLFKQTGGPMDRHYKAEDKVHVYQSYKRGPLLDTVELKPYSMHGFDYYRYKDTMYPGFYCREELKVYILLDQPLKT